MSSVFQVQRFEGTSENTRDIDSNQVVGSKTTMLFPPQLRNTPHCVHIE